MKYILFQDQTGARWPVLFPDHICHDQVKVDSCKPVSAGFVDPHTGEPHGKSESLKLTINAEDERWLAAALMGSNAELYLLNVERLLSEP